MTLLLSSQAEHETPEKPPLDQCDKNTSLVNQCFNADRTAFTCCPHACGQPLKAVPHCEGSVLGDLPTQHMYPFPEALGSTPGPEESDYDYGDQVFTEVPNSPLSDEEVPYEAANLPPLETYGAFEDGYSLPALDEDDALTSNFTNLIQNILSQNNRRRSLLSKTVAQIRVVFVVVLSPSGEGDVSDNFLLDVVNRINLFWQDMPFRFRPVFALRVKSKKYYILNFNDDSGCRLKSIWRRGTAEDLFIYIVQDITTPGQPGHLHGFATFPNQYQFRPHCDGVVVRHGRIPGYTEELTNGDTFAHEIGHWLGLIHTFQGALVWDFFSPFRLRHRDGCSRYGGDDVNDTPKQKDDEILVRNLDGSIGNGQPSLKDCGRPIFRCPKAVDSEPIWNLMAYGECRQWFTRGQAKRAVHIWEKFRRGVGPSVVEAAAQWILDVYTKVPFPKGVTHKQLPGDSELATVTVDINTRNGLALRRQPTTDIAFVLDVSNSVDGASYDKERQFIASAITTLRDDGFFTGRGSVTVIQFATSTSTIVDSSHDATATIEAVRSMPRAQAGGTAIGDALLQAQNILSGGTGAEKVIILITDGMSNIGVDPQPVADLAKASGFTIIGIGVGSALEKSKIVPLTSSTGFEENYYFAITDFYGLKSLLNAVLAIAFAFPDDIVVRGLVADMFPAIQGLEALNGTLFSPTDHSFEWRVGQLQRHVGTWQMRFSIKIGCASLPAGPYSIFSSLTWEDRSGKYVKDPPLYVYCSR